MRDLDRQDFVLIERAKKAIRACYGQSTSTTGAALRCASGNVYTGVDIAGRGGACAEVIALGTARASGETGFECLVCVGGPESDKILPPCGSCRELLLAHCPEVEVILHIGQTGAKKLDVRELLPHAKL